MRDASVRCVVVLLSTTLLSACSGGSGTAPLPCPAAPMLTLTGGDIAGVAGTTHSGTLPTSTNELIFSNTNATLVSNPPTLLGSNGSSIVGARMTSVGFLANGAKTGPIPLYYSRISGLQPNTTYTVTFPVLTSDAQPGVPAGCMFAPETAGVFQTSS